MQPDCGPRPGLRTSLSRNVASSIIPGMCGGCYGSWGGVASGPPAGRWNGTRRRSGAGNSGAGRRLKKAQKEGRTILFVDESGISQRPHRVRTWSPRGETPVLQYNFNWDTISAAAGITLFSFYFRLYEGTIKSPEVVDFLQALLRHIPGPLWIVWDRLSAHKSKLTRDFIAGQGERWWVEYLPAYAPELNPVEYIWAYWKQHALPNVCPKDYWELGEGARRTLKKMRRRPRLIRAFWQQAELSF